MKLNASGVLDEQSEVLKAEVRRSYGAIARNNGSCCGGGSCGTGPEASLAVGYSADELTSVPDGANLGLGCGNPLLMALLNEGEVVLDLGSGAGFDCFLAAQKVGPRGRVIGVDMTADMVAKARQNARQGGFENVEFRLGEIEHLPVANEMVDVIISNCVINLSTDKQAVLKEAFRALKHGGRISISDIVALQPLPEEVRTDLALYSGCMAGATPIGELRAALEKAGFEGIRITQKQGSQEFIQEWAPNRGIENYVTSATIEARKP